MLRRMTPSAARRAIYVPVVDASEVRRSFNMSDGEEDEAGLTDGEDSEDRAGRYCL